MEKEKQKIRKLIILSPENYEKIRKLSTSEAIDFSDPEEAIKLILNNSALTPSQKVTLFQNMFAVLQNTLSQLASEGVDIADISSSLRTKTQKPSEMSISNTLTTENSQDESNLESTPIISVQKTSDSPFKPNSFSSPHSSSEDAASRTVVTPPTFLAPPKVSTPFYSPSLVGFSPNGPSKASTMVVKTTYTPPSPESSKSGKSKKNKQRNTRAVPYSKESPFKMGDDEMEDVGGNWETYEKNAKKL